MKTLAAWGSWDVDFVREQAASAAGRIRAIGSVAFAGSFCAMRWSRVTSKSVKGRRLIPFTAGQTNRRRDRCPPKGTDHGPAGYGLETKEAAVVISTLRRPPGKIKLHE